MIDLIIGGFIVALLVIMVIPVIVIGGLFLYETVGKMIIAFYQAILIEPLREYFQKRRNASFCEKDNKGGNQH